jgi:hypothetical protein
VIVFWAFFEITKVAHIFGLLFPQLGLFLAKDGLGYILGYFFYLQTHLLTLRRNLLIIAMYNSRNGKL